MNSKCNKETNNHFHTNHLVRKIKETRTIRQIRLNKFKESNHQLRLPKVKG